MDLSLRRSSRLGHAQGHAGDRVTAATGIGPTSSSAVQSTSSKNTTFANMKTSNKKTASTNKKSTSTILKRKSQSVGSKSKKKSRMDEEFTQEEPLAIEVAQILEPLLKKMDQVIDIFLHHKEEAWHTSLVTRRKLISLMITEVISLEDLQERPELEPFIMEGYPGSIAEEDREGREGTEFRLIEQKFTDLETCRSGIIYHLEPPAPSKYCLGSTYRRAQSISGMVVRDGRTKGTAPVALELLHVAFRAFTYWSFLDPYPLPGSSSQEKREINKGEFINVYQTANQLLLSMPQLYATHEDRLEDFKKILLLIFPENDKYEWVLNTPADQGHSNVKKYRVDIVYRHKGSKIPLIFVEVKLELGEGGNPFWQNHRLYQSYTKSNPKSRYNGAPVFLVQLCGTHLGIGGGFCDALGDNVSPVVLQLGGYVNLQYDYVGRNLCETVNTLWALHEAIKLIPSQYDSDDSRLNLLDIPRYVKNNPIVKIIRVLHPGVVYLAKYIKGSQNVVQESEIKENLAVKIIYSGISFEPYGGAVHTYLASKDMAPKYYFPFHISDKRFPKDAKVLEDHHLMEYLPPPSKDSAGWISLVDLERKFPVVALRDKQDIKAALYDIIKALGEKNYVHGDLRPNNLLILIEYTADGCSIERIERNPEQNPEQNPARLLPYLKVIDFDWAGVAGVVEYPPHRNPDLWWPGTSGNCIEDTHDNLMIDSWLAKWPRINVSDDEEDHRRGPHRNVLDDEEDHRRGEPTYLHISNKFM